MLLDFAAIVGESLSFYTEQQFNELITEHEETINSIIIEKENKDSKTKKYIAYPIIAAAGIGAALFMVLIIAFSTY